MKYLLAILLFVISSLTHAAEEYSEVARCTSEYTIEPEDGSKEIVVKMLLSMLKGDESTSLLMVNTTILPKEIIENAEALPQEGFSKSVTFGKITLSNEGVYTVTLNLDEENDSETVVAEFKSDTGTFELLKSEDGFSYTCLTIED